MVIRNRSVVVSYEKNPGRRTSILAAWNIGTAISPDSGICGDWMEPDVR